MSQRYKHYYFTLDVSYHESQVIYTQAIPHAVIRAETGERVQVPMARLRQCITSSGLRGRYQLTVDAQNKCIKFAKL